MPSIDIPLHTVMELTPKADGTMAETRFIVDVDKARGLSVSVLSLVVLVAGGKGHVVGGWWQGVWWQRASYCFRRGCTPAWLIASLS